MSKQKDKIQQPHFSDVTLDIKDANDAELKETIQWYRQVIKKSEEDFMNGRSKSNYGIQYKGCLALAETELANRNGK